MLKANNSLSQDKNNHILNCFESWQQDCKMPLSKEKWTYYTYSRVIITPEKVSVRSIFIWERNTPKYLGLNAIAHKIVQVLVLYLLHRGKSGRISSKMALKPWKKSMLLKFGIDECRLGTRTKGILTVPSEKSWKVND